MLPSPLIMHTAEISGAVNFATKTSAKTSFWFSETFKNICNYLDSIFSFPPISWVTSFYVFRIIFMKFKIFYSIVCFDAIYVMNCFASFKFSAKMLLHNITMLKDSFAVYVYAKITKFCEVGLSFLEIRPVWGNEIIIFMSKEPSSVHLANTSLGFFENFLTSFNFTGITNNHISNYNKMRYICQM